MGKAKIISGGTAGRYEIENIPLKNKAEDRIDKLGEEVDKIRNGEDVVFSPSLSDQHSALHGLLVDYTNDIEENRSKEEDQAELTNEIATAKNKLDRMEDELSDLESIRDEYKDEYDDAQDQYDMGEITEAELDWWKERYDVAEANVIAKSASVAGQQAVVTNLEAEKSALTFAPLDADLETIKKKAATFLEYDAKEPVSQLDTHLDYGESLLNDMSDALDAAINWYSDAIKQNYEDSTDKADWDGQLYPLTVSEAEAYTRLQSAKSAMDSAQDDYDEQYLLFLRGEIEEEDLEPYADTLSEKQGIYSARLATYNYWHDQTESLQADIDGCVSISTDPMYKRMVATATVAEQMRQDVASLKVYRDRRELEATSLEMEKDRLEAELDRSSRKQGAWCADLTEDLEADSEVGTIEINAEIDTVLIHPGYEGAAVYDRVRDGQTQPPAISTPAQAFYNFALLPGHQRWKPSYRLGTIRSLDGDLAVVDLDAAKSAAQNLDINGGLETIADVPIEYMSCNGAAFEEGDRVVVKFADGDWDQPTVIGFEEEPQPCTLEIRVIRDDGEVLTPTHAFKIQLKTAEEELIVDSKNAAVLFEENHFKFPTEILGEAKEFYINVVPLGIYPVLHKTVICQCYRENDENKYYIYMPNWYKPANAFKAGRHDVAAPLFYSEYFTTPNEPEDLAYDPGCTQVGGLMYVPPAAADRLLAQVAYFARGIRVYSSVKYDVTWNGQGYNNFLAVWNSSNADAIPGCNTWLGVWSIANPDYPGVLEWSQTTNPAMEDDEPYQVDSPSLTGTEYVLNVETLFGHSTSVPMVRAVYDGIVDYMYYMGTGFDSACEWSTWQEWLVCWEEYAARWSIPYTYINVTVTCRGHYLEWSPSFVAEVAAERQG